MELEQVGIPVADGEIRAEIAGDGSPVVMLHAGGLGAQMWDDQVEFADERAIVRYDARSHGRSSTAIADFRLEDDLLAVLDHLEIPKAALVGNSMGGATALAFALRHPDRVDRLALAGPGVPPVEFHDPFIRAEHREQAAAIEAVDADRYISSMLRMAVDGPHRGPGDVLGATRERCREMFAATVRAHHTATGAILEADVRSRLAEIDVPTLVVLGELEADDLWRMARLLVDGMPDVRLEVIPGVGHMSGMEKPGEFNRLLRGFLR
ncbi:alpha/beta fold hydrolase [Saccharopolyspora griseoalba]|uniref:Alpha/beta fold hydrolase n=1 Tax=Saccharopolyspora griseoalba TaxID=1431848 RepID=A0ABW2LR56_9PSEU